MTSSAADVLRIGCASCFWGDTEFGARQLVDGGKIDVLVFDYLAEITMSILARAKAKDPTKGYAVDFIKVLAPLLPEIAHQGIRVISNAGGLNPDACADALRAELSRAGLDLRVAVVKGDDLMMRLSWLKEQSIREMGTGEELPPTLVSANAYLGARPIAAALDRGADIIITGRCVDSAVTLGPLVHHFGWKWDEYDKLAQGSLAGHIIECGTQGTGGLFTDWRDVPGWDDMGFPIVECGSDGVFVVTKPPNTGGLVTPPTVAEQIVYEIGDPQTYVLPDVICDFSEVALSQVGPDRVRVVGARGRPPGGAYKVCATYADGFRITATLMIGGIDAAAKGERVAEAMLTRLRRILKEKGFQDFREANVEILGAEAMYGPHSRARSAREVIVKVGARHESKDALDLLGREWYSAAAAMAPGISGVAGGRPAPSGVVRLFSFLLPKAVVPASIGIDGETFNVEMGRESSAPILPVRPEVRIPTAARSTVDVPLIRVAHGRSGDKADTANIGLIARRPEIFPILAEQVTAERVAAHFSYLLKGTVERYLMPGMHALNFVMTQSLGGGGVASLRYDPQGKAFAQMLLDMTITVPATLLESGSVQ
ncbi:MAG: acyclic terpene utilization AtuA family protein [Hyphomicrobiaceae bacterium]